MKTSSTGTTGPKASLPTEVYVLVHLHAGDPEGKLIGVYSSLEKAEAARARAVLQPGFRDHPTGFQIGRGKLDEATWLTDRFPHRVAG